MISIITLTGGSAILLAILGWAIVDVLIHRETANIVERQIQTMVQASQSIAPAILESIPDCSGNQLNPATMSRLAYLPDAFPEAQYSLEIEDREGVHVLWPQSDGSVVQKPSWLRQAGFNGLIVDKGKLEIRHMAVRQRNECRLTAIVSLPLGAKLAERLAAAGDVDVLAVPQHMFHVHPPNTDILRTVDANFLPGALRPTGVVLTFTEWTNGELQDWLVYNVGSSRTRTFQALATLGQQRANWVWQLGVLSTAGLLLYVSAVLIGVRLSQQIVVAIDNLGVGAQQVGSGNFDYRMAVPSKDQLGDLACNFNLMAAALKRLHQEDIARQRLESEIEVARRVQDFLFPRTVPELAGVTLAGRTQPARLLGGDLYDFFLLSPERVCVLCADVSGKGVPAALMMSNLQAIARAQAGADHFVQALNRQLTGRFGDNRYATLFWVDFDARTGTLRYINAAHPAAILMDATGRVERLASDGFPIGMFRDATYEAREVHTSAGSRLVIFTDGITDALNRQEEEYGDERLLALCRRLDVSMDAASITEAIVQSVSEWSGKVEQFDDLTVVVITIDPSQKMAATRGS